MDKLLRLRQEFPGVERANYLFASQLGAMPRGAREAFTHYANDWETRGGSGWVERWSEEARRIGDLVAPLLGALPGEVSMHPSLAAAVVAALSPLCAGQTAYEVLYEASLSAEAASESKRHLAGALNTELLSTLETLPALTLRPARAPGVAPLMEAMQERAPRLVMLSQVVFSSGLLHTDEELVALCQAAEKVGAKVLLDVEHSAGVMPLHLANLGVDLAVGSCTRWLCGGPGSGFLWARATRPTERFAPNLAAHTAAAVGLRLIAHAGLTEIREKSRRQTQRVIDGALARGFKVLTPREPQHRGGTVSIQLPHAYEVFRALRERRILLDYNSATGLRVAPHFYNHDDELDALLSQIDDILDRHDYERFRGR